MPQPYILAVLLLGLAVSVAVVRADVRVNLINPYFTSVRWDSGDLNSTILSLRTRAAEYKLTLSWANNTGSLVRTSDSLKLEEVFSQDKVRIGYDQTKTYTEIRDKAHEDLSSLSKKKETYNYVSLCQARTHYTSKESRLVEVCAREGFVSICANPAPPNGEACNRIGYWSTNTFKNLAPITAIAIRITNGVVESIVINARGVISQSTNLLVTPPSVPNTIQTRSMQLAALDIQDDSNPSSYWQNRNDIINKLPDIKSKLEVNLRDRLRASYIDAISMYNGSAQGLGSNVLCYGSYYESRRDGRQLNCFERKIITPEPSELIHITAYHHTERLVKGQLTTYTHVFWKSELDGKTASTYEFCNKSLAAPDTDQCAKQRKSVIYPPNDLTGWRDDKCDVLVSFYDLLYNLSPYDQRLGEAMDINLQKVNGLNFYINAVMVKEKTFYFFTHANNLIQVEASMDVNCKSLTFRWGTKRDLPGDRYILRYLNGKLNDNELGPSIVDYREIAENEPDTVPSASDYTWNSTQSRGASLTPILFILILGVLGLAIIGYTIYYFCFSTRDDRLTLTAPSSTNNPDNLISNTVRSAQISQYLQPSPASSTSSASPTSTTTLRAKSKASKEGSGVKSSAVAHKSKKSKTKSKKSPKQPTSKSPRSPKSSKSLKSIKSIKSPKSPKSPTSTSKLHKSTDSKRPTKSPKSRSKH